MTLNPFNLVPSVSMLEFRYVWIGLHPNPEFLLGVFGKAHPVSVEKIESVAHQSIFKGGFSILEKIGNIARRFAHRAVDSSCRIEALYEGDPPVVEALLTGGAFSEPLIKPAFLAVEPRTVRQEFPYVLVLFSLAFFGENDFI